MAEPFSPGDRVRARRADPPHHTRLPRYARGAVGTVVERQGRYPLPEDRARRLPAAAQDKVHLDLWESYLRPVEAG